MLRWLRPPPRRRSQPLPTMHQPVSPASFLSEGRWLAVKAEKEPINICAEPPSSSTPVVTPSVDPLVLAPQDAEEQSGTGILCVSDASAQPSGSSTTLIVVDDKEKQPSSTRARSLRSDRAVRVLGHFWLELGRYVATGQYTCSVAKWRPSLARALLLRSNRAVRFLDRYIATDLGSSSVATSLVRARSLRSDRAVCMHGRCVAILHGLSVVRLPYSSSSVAGLDTSVALGQPVFDSIEI
ncbi:hypothetical protein DY000_02031741 [Brassica cretica]|uniref:Uncharacterized protein n=1 Tax=Brassica cretica TaxID=69181 RepID=A0ABQ7DW97_BRACR|nr:hypothetical protein DY000_02031741 [Brassica cretica]